jgi:TonB family protein
MVNQALMKKIFFFLLAILLTMNVSAQKAEVFRYVEQMPQADYNVWKFLGENMRYPDSARKLNIEGRVVVQFVVMENGIIDSVKAIGTKKLGYGLEEEAVRVIKLMPRWNPGRQNGVPVKVYFTQPLNFKLEDNEAPVEILRYVEQMPAPEYNLAEYFSQNMRYPDSARKNNIEGRINVRFIVTETGKIDSVITTGDKILGYGLEEEAIRLVKLMPPWRPAKQSGKPIKIYFTQPITFRLTDNTH